MCGVEDIVARKHKDVHFAQMRLYSSELPAVTVGLVGVFTTLKKHWGFQVEATRAVPISADNDNE